MRDLAPVLPVKNPVRSVVLLAVTGLFLSGCGLQQLSQGEPNFNTAILLPPDPGPAPARLARDPVRLRLSPAALPAECTTALPGEMPKDQVRRCVYALKSIIDDDYREYRITLHHFADDSGAAADIAQLGLTTAATATGAAAAKTVLAAIATALGGTKTIVNQDVLYKQTIEIVLNQMDADRDHQFTIMLGEMKTDDYGFEQAKNDLLQYFADGTFDHAVTSLQTKTAANQANCKATLDAAKVGNAPEAVTSTNATGCSDPGAAEK